MGASKSTSKSMKEKPSWLTQHTRFEIWAVALAVEAAAVILRSNHVNLLHLLSFSFVDLLVDLLAPMEELLCGT